MSAGRWKQFRLKVKRVIDIVVAVGLLLVLSPVFLLIYVLVHIKMGTPAIFAQQRPGLNGEPFTLFKFRSMLDAVDEDGLVLSDEDRLTKFGSLLRRSSLDELPELWNVLKGEMSLVGPRPLLMEYLDLYTPEQMRRHDVRPGITGWAQVNGRNAISWEEKFEYDIWYVHNQSILLDLKILLLTISSVFSVRGISQQGEATVKYFQGSEVVNEERPEA